MNKRFVAIAIAGALVSIPAVASFLQYTDGSGRSIDTAVIMWLSGGNAVPAATATPLPVSSAPGARTIVPLRVGSVTTGGTAVTVLNAGDRTAGGNIQTWNAAGICISENGTAATTAGVSGGVLTECVSANQPFYLTPSANAVSVNSTASGVVLAGKGLQ